MVSFLKYLEQTNETASAGSVSAGGIAGFRGMLFGGPDTLQRRPKVGKVEVIQFNNDGPHEVKQKPTKKKAVREGERQGANKQLITGVLSKLRSNVRQSAFNYTNDVTTYGLEDDSGNTVKVVLPTEQSKEFEQKLMSLLRNDRKRGERGFTSKQIGEILFDMRKEFDIVNVVWPKISGDSEEEEVKVPGDMEQPADGQSPTGEDGVDPNAPPSTGDMSHPTPEDTTPVSSLLQQIIQMMQADAEAKMVQAKAEEAKYVQQISAQKMEQEQEVLDMEAYYKSKKKEEGESKKLQRLAQWKHEMAQEEGSDLTSSSPDINLNVNLDGDQPDANEEDSTEEQLPPITKKPLPTDEIPNEEEEEATTSTGQLTNTGSQRQLLKYLLNHTKAQK